MKSCGSILILDTILSIGGRLLSGLRLHCEKKATDEQNWSRFQVVALLLPQLARYIGQMAGAMFSRLL